MTRSGGPRLFPPDAYLMLGVFIVSAGAALAVANTSLTFLAGPLFALVMACGLALGLSSPALAVLVAFVSIPFGGVEVPFGGRTPKLFFAHILVAGAILGAVSVYVSGRVVAHRSADVDSPAHPALITWSVMLYIALVGVGMLDAYDTMRSGYLYVNRVLVMGAFLVALGWLRSRPARGIVMVLAAVVGLLISAVYTWALLTTYRPSTFADLSQALTAKDNLARAGFLGVTNTIASLMAFTIPLTSGLFSWRKRRSVRRLAVLSLTVQVAVLLSTASRGGILALIIGLAGALLLGTAGVRFLKQALYAGVGAWAVFWIALRVMPADLLVRYQVYFDPLVMAEYAWRRTELWLTSWRAFREHPVFGIGIGNVGVYDLVSGTGDGSETHNLVLQTLAEEGFLAFLAFAIVLCWMMCRLIAMCRRNRRWVQTGALWCLLATLVNSMVEPSFWAPQFAFLFWPAMGALVTGTVFVEGQQPA